MKSTHDFSYIIEGLQNVAEGDKKRDEIFAVFDEFKEEVQTACLHLFGKVVYFKDSFQNRLATILTQRNYERPNSGEVSLSVEPYAFNLTFFKYELDPVAGYPVILRYAGKSVMCSDKNALYATIRDAYQGHVRELRDVCEKGGLKSMTLAVSRRK